MKIKMILKKGMVFLFAAAMAVTGVFSLGVMAASGLEGAYISPKSKMGLEFANNFDRAVSKSQVDVPNFMADAGVLLDTLQFVLPSIAFGLTVTLYYSLSRAFGHGFGYTVGIMFLPFIFAPLLGVGRSRYTRPDKYRDKF